MKGYTYGVLQCHSLKGLRLLFLDLDVPYSILVFRLVGEVKDKLLNSKYFQTFW